MDAAAAATATVEPAAGESPEAPVADEPMAEADADGRQDAGVAAEAVGQQAGAADQAGLPSAAAAAAAVKHVDSDGDDDDDDLEIEEAEPAPQVSHAYVMGTAQSLLSTMRWLHPMRG